ncbi:MAG: putative beta-lysine N-acetyltransferase [Bacillota bacterium]|nr:putative beta-lysine N-acetyltransferase [Bacillota bacterium]
MHCHSADSSSLVRSMKKLAEQEGYTKIVAKVPENDWPLFKKHGYKAEAKIPRYYKNGHSCFFACHYLVADRAVIKNEKMICTALKTAQNKVEKESINLAKGIGLPDHLKLRQLTENDVTELAGLYSKVFASYPFPIQDEMYLIKTMREHVFYYGLYHTSKLIAAASSETDPDQQNSEMTDFAVLPQHRGQRLAACLLAEMEKAMVQKGFQTFYTIARATSIGMNTTFVRAGYAYGGTLINNTQIAGQIESMNVWYKTITRPDLTS